MKSLSFGRILTLYQEILPEIFQTLGLLERTSLFIITMVNNVLHTVFELIKTAHNKVQQQAPPAGHNRNKFYFFTLDEKQVVFKSVR